MASTVIEAFEHFLKNKVNLAPSVSKDGRSSRDWLLDRIESFPSKSITFPFLYPEKHIAYGSFARRTKIRELDDIDLMICLHASGSKYSGYINDIIINVPESAERLRKLCNNSDGTLNSKKVINAFVSELTTVPQYKKADISRNMEAVILDLSSYAWSFDIVPCFFTVPDQFGNTFYIIPDGYGKWKKTDPRKDRDRVTEINQSHNGYLLNLVRIIKFWNKRATMPSMPSYMLETIIVDYFKKNDSPKLSPFVDIHIPEILHHLSSIVFSQVNDPKGIQGNINSLSMDEKIRISVRASLDYKRAKEAREKESDSNMEASIKKWAEIFGLDYPSYG